jgi:hypothetical protein
MLSFALQEPLVPGLGLFDTTRSFWKECENFENTMTYYSTSYSSHLEALASI